MPNLQTSRKPRIWLKVSTHTKLYLCNVRWYPKYFALASQPLGDSFARSFLRPSGRNCNKQPDKMGHVFAAVEGEVADTYSDWTRWTYAARRDWHLQPAETRA